MMTAPGPHDGARPGSGWSLTPARPPDAAPVSLEELRLHLRVDADEEDQLLRSLLTAARVMVEARAGVALLEQEWTLWLDRWPGPVVRLPHGPVRRIVSVSLRGLPDSGGAGSEAMTPVDAAIYDASLPERAQVRLRAGASWPRPLRPDAGIAVRFAAGFGVEADAVPAPLRQAVLMLAAHWYENRTAFGHSTELPGVVAALIAPYREIRLCPAHP